MLIWLTRELDRLITISLHLSSGHKVERVPRTGTVYMLQGGKRFLARLTGRLAD